jgi:hypothetical protein
MKTTTVRIPDEVQEALALSAGRNYRSMHGEILEALRHYAQGCAISDCKITTEEKRRIFDKGPDYVELAKKRKEKIKELEQTVSQLEETILRMSQPVEEVVELEESKGVA